MSELSKYLVEQILLEDNSPIKKVVVVYVGRFQPFHKGHNSTYQHLVKKFGKDNVFIGTSNKVEKPKSPFNFKEKVKIMNTMFGISSSKIVEVKNPYKPTEVLSKFDENTTAFVTVVGEKDSGRLGGKYFTPYKGEPTEGYKDRGYVYVAPSGGGGVSGTEVRNGLSVGSDEQKQDFFTDRAYDKFNKEIFKMITDKLNESICIRKETIEDWLISEASVGGSGQADDGPSFMFPNYDVFKNVSSKLAAKIGFEVVDMIMNKELQDYYTHPTYPDGPVQSVSYFPAGIIGANTPNNQADVYSSGAYSDWFKHATRKASLIGYELVSRELYSGDKTQATKTASGAKQIKESIERRLVEDITLPVNIGDTILMGKFKNKRVVVKSIGKDEHGMPTINGKKVVTFRFINEDRIVELAEMAKSDLDAVEKFADSKLSPEDIDFTNHFFDRVNDPRNDKPITTAELTGFFKRLARHKKSLIDFLQKYEQIVLKDKRTDINIPLVKNTNKIIAKTIMRKSNFSTPNPVLSFEQLAKGMDLKDIANKHQMDIDELVPEFQQGIKVEMEHTQDRKVAERIALDHLFEDPKYYTKLATIEELAPHGYPDQEWMDNHEKEMKKLRTQLDKMNEGSSNAGYTTDGEPDGIFLTNGQVQKLGRRGGKPDYWFKNGGYTQVHFPKADNIYKSDDESQQVKTVRKVKNVTKSTLEPPKPDDVPKSSIVKEIWSPGGPGKFYSTYKKDSEGNYGTFLSGKGMDNQSAFKMIMDGLVPVSGPMITEVTGGIRKRTFHATDDSGYNSLVKLQGKKKSISTFDKTEPSINKMAVGGGVNTRGGILAVVEGTVLLQSPNDAWTYPDKSGRRWANIMRFTGLNTMTWFDMIQSDNLIDSTLQKMYEYKVGISDVEPSSGEKSALVKRYIDLFYKFVRANKEKVKEHIIHQGVFYKDTDGYNEIVMNDIKIIDAIAFEAYIEDVPKFKRDFPKVKIGKDKDDFLKFYRGYGGKAIGMGDGVVRKNMNTLNETPTNKEPINEVPIGLLFRLVVMILSKMWPTVYDAYSYVRYLIAPYKWQKLFRRLQKSEEFKKDLVKILQRGASLYSIGIMQEIEKLQSFKNEFDKFVKDSNITDESKIKELKEQILTVFRNSFYKYRIEIRSAIYAEYPELNPNYKNNENITEAQAVSGGKVHKFITGKNLTLKGKKYPEIEFEVLGIDNSSQLVKLKVLSPNNLFGEELKVPFKTIRRGPFLKTDTKLSEKIVGDDVVCDNCGWKWKISEGGLDIFTCHKCGHTNETSIKEGILSEGGAYGHMSHPFDTEINLTFGHLKDIVNRALDGDLELTREKTDGQALAISWVGGRLVAARNKGHLKNKGANALDIQGVASKFAGRGELEKAYNFAMQDLTNAIKSLSDKQRDKIFKGGACFMNIEVIYPTSVNVIPYGQPLLVFHGTMEYNDAGEAIGENQDAARILAGMIKQVNQHVQDNYTIQGPPVVSLPKSQHLSSKKGKYTSQISKLQGEFGLKDTDGVAEYHQAWWTQWITKNSPSTLDNKTLMGLVKRWAFFDKSFRLDNKNIQDEKTLEWAKKVDKEDQSKISKENLMKFEDIFLGLGAEVLEFTSSVLTVNPDSAIRDMKNRLEQTVSDVRKSGDPKKIEKLKLELRRLQAIGGPDKIVPIEGIVFVYNGNTFKLTGAFASLNQLLGIFYS